MRKVSVFVLILAFTAAGFRLAFAENESNGDGNNNNNIENGMFRVITEEELSTIGTAGTGSGSAGRGLVYYVIPASVTGTGYDEGIQYQIPSGYNPLGSGHPLMVCWHGFGTSCKSVALSSQIDEECEERNWIFLSIRGAFQTSFGYLPAQINCTVAIDYMINTLGLNIDQDRIYMAGFSMGSCACSSYACRHMSEQDKYPIAGLILVAPVHDWTHAYVFGDPGVQYWLTMLLGGSPTQFPFEYKQISSMFIDNGSYVLEESMGQNLRQGLPVFFTYAGNDPLLYLVYQNTVFKSMLDGIGAVYSRDYITYDPDPHSWSLLDVEAAFDFVENYTLEDQEIESITVLADRAARFYWADFVEQAAVGSFSMVSGDVDQVQNTLDISEASNLSALGVDCTVTGLGDDKNLLFTYQSSDTAEQTIELSPVAAEPTYIVDTYGKLYPEYSYDGGSETVSITRGASEDLDLKVSFEEYNLSLTADETVSIDEIYTLNLSGGDPFDTFVLLFAFEQVETKVGSHHLLASVLPPIVMFWHVLDGSGELVLPLQVPDDPGIVGTIVYHQYLTYTGYYIKELSNLAITEITN